MLPGVLWVALGVCRSFLRFICAPWVFVVAPWGFLGFPWGFVGFPWDFVGFPWGFHAFPTAGGCSQQCVSSRPGSDVQRMGSEPDPAQGPCLAHTAGPEQAPGASSGSTCPMSLSEGISKRHREGHRGGSDPQVTAWIPNWRQEGWKAGPVPLQPQPRAGRAGLGGRQKLLKPLLL